MRRLVIIPSMACLLGARLPAAETTTIYQGTFDGDDGSGSIGLAIRGPDSADQRPTSISCQKDGSTHRYQGQFDAQAADGKVHGSVSVEDEPWEIAGTVDQGRLQAIYYRSGEADMPRGNITARLVPPAPSTTPDDTP